MANVRSYVPDFRPVKQAFALLNATPEEIIVRWGGLQVTIPPVDVVGHRPAKDEEGNPIAGTAVIEDGYGPDTTGRPPSKGSPPNWFAADAIKNILQIDPDSGEAIGPSARKGISVLPVGPTTYQIEEARAHGKERYQAFLVEWANETVQAYQTARERNQMAGYAPPPPGTDYQRAVLILQKAHQKLKQEMGFELDAVEEGVDKDALQFEAFAQAEAMALAKKAAESANVDQTELAEKLLQNPEVRNKLKRKYSIRQRGHMDVPLTEDA